jgi:hypothetical protein
MLTGFALVLFLDYAAARQAAARQLVTPRSSSPRGEDSSFPPVG